MKKRGIAFLCLMLLLVATSICIVACDMSHTHAFTVKSVDDRYLASPATCAQPATYYYSCMCGETGTATFTIGNALGHQFAEWQVVKEASITENGLRTRICTREGCGHIESESIPMIPHTHNFNQKLTDEKYLATVANCTEPATYYYSCACGAKDTTTTFFSGSALGHSYSTEWSYDQTEHWHAATCGHEAEIDRAVHTFDSNNTCTVCKFNRVRSVTNIFFDKQELSLDVGKTETLLTTVLPLDVAGVTLTWSSTAPSVASVKDGTVTALAKGTAVIIAACGEISATCAATVTDPFEDYVISPDGDFYAIAAYIGNKKEVEIPSTYNGKPITAIGNSAFENCTRLTSVTIPDGIITIGSSAFVGCRGLTNVTISDSVKTIKDYAFEGCISLRSILIPAGITSIEQSAFRGCSALTSVSWNAENCPFVGFIPIFEGCDNLTTATIGDNVKTIPESVFYQCTSLTNVTIGRNVTSIGGTAFFECSKLESIVIPDTVTTIWYNTFSGCVSLKNIKIPDNVTTIGENAFQGCTGLKSIEIPNNVTSIGFGAFEGCSNLELNEYDNALYLGNSTNPYIVLVKAKLTDITSCEISEKCMFIQDSAFKGCSTLVDVVVPDSIISVQSYAFSGCVNLEYNEFDNALYLGNSTNPYVVLIKAKSTDVTSCEISKNCKVIYGSSFSDCKGLTNIEIPDNVMMICDDAFSNCSGLKSVIIGSSLTVIGCRAFIHCSGLTSIIIPDGVTEIGGYAFYKCSGLKSIEIPNTIMVIYNSAFFGCEGAENIKYNGTKSQWQAILKWFNWDSETGNYTIHCTDGDIIKA